MASGDAFVRFDRENTAWTCRTGLVEQRLEFNSGKFLLANLRNRLTGSEYVAGAGSDEFRFLLDGKEYTGATGGYRLVDYKIARLPVPKASPGIEPGVSLRLVLCQSGRIRAFSIEPAVRGLSPARRAPRWGMIQKDCITVTNLTDRESSR